MPVLANARHERFAQNVAKGLTGRQAYFEAGFDTTNNEAADAAASRLLGTAKVRARVTELQERVATKVEISLADILAELDQARDIALSAATPQAGAAVAASMGRAKLLGYVTDKIKADVTISHEDALAALR